MILIRVDVSPTIGSGHVMRCSAIVHELKALGEDAVFAVSNRESTEFVQAKKQAAYVLPGDPHKLGSADARQLANLARDFNAKAILIDTYGASEAFFEELKFSVQDNVSIAAMDDKFTYAEGQLEKPHRWAVDMLVNYGFNASKTEYETTYSGTSTRYFVGPAYAPLRSEFRAGTHPCSTDVTEMLITSGSTNPQRLLEGLVEAVRLSVPQAHLHVVVGPHASCEVCSSESVTIHRGVSSMSDLMAKTDIALSAAGSTLYELAAMGVPTIAIPIVENQIANAVGFERLGLGVAFDFHKRLSEELVSAIRRFSEDVDTRFAMARRGQQIVDGFGAFRLAKAIAACRK